jgi:hypothetical protein
MTVSPESELYEVSAREFTKMKYLVSVIEVMDAMYKDFKSWQNTVVMTKGVIADARIDWRAVAQFCAPQVLVVLAHDPKGNEFEDHPRYAILPESRQHIPLTGIIHLAIKESDDGQPEVDVLGALNSLSTYVETIDGGKRENAMRQLHILRRILR